MVALGEVLSLCLDAHAVEPEVTYPTLGVYGFGRGIITNKPPVQGNEIAASVLYQVRADQFIYSKLKAFEGAFALVTPDGDGRFVSNEFPTFDCRAGKLLPAYLAWFFRRPSAWESVSAESSGIGARRERLHPDSLLTYKVPLPPLPEQRRIVARLDAVATRLTARTEAAQRLEADLAALLRATFTRITAGSPRARMADIAPLVRRPVTIEPEASYTEIGIRSFFRGIFHRRTVPGSEFTWQDLFRIEAGDVVFSNLMAWEKGIGLAGAADTGCVGNHRMLTCAPDRSRVVSAFLFFFFTTPEGFAQIEAASPGSIARNKTLSPDGLKAIEVPVPSLDAQRWFDRLQAKVNAARAQHAAVAAEADTLLPAMLHQVFGTAPC